MTFVSRLQCLTRFSCNSIHSLRIFKAAMWDHTSDSYVNIATKFTFETGVCRSSGVYTWLQPQTLYSSKQCLCSKQNNCALPPLPPICYHDDQWWRKAGVRDDCPQTSLYFTPHLMTSEQTQRVPTGKWPPTSRFVSNLEKCGSVLL